MFDRCCGEGSCVDPRGRVDPAAVACALGVVAAWGDMPPQDRELEVRFRDLTPDFYAHAAAMAAASPDLELLGTDVLTDVTHSDGVRSRRCHRDRSVTHARKEGRRVADLVVRPGPGEHEGFPEALRVAAVVERPVEVSAAYTRPTFFRRQVRTSYGFRGCRLDMGTVVEGATYDAMESAVPAHSIEIEMLDPGSRPCHGILATSLVLKMLGFADDPATRVVSVDTPAESLA